MGASSTGATQGLTRDRKTLVELPNPATGLGSGSARGPQSATSRHPAPKRLPASVSRLNGSRRSRRVLTPPNRLMARHSTSPSDPRAKRRSGPLLRSRRSRQPTALGGRRRPRQSPLMRWGATRDGRHRTSKIATESPLETFSRPVILLMDPRAVWRCLPNPSRCPPSAWMSLMSAWPQPKRISRFPGRVCTIPERALWRGGRQARCLSGQVWHARRLVRCLTRRFWRQGLVGDLRWLSRPTKGQSRDLARQARHPGRLAWRRRRKVWRLGLRRHLRLLGWRLGSLAWRLQRPVWPPRRLVLGPGLVPEPRPLACRLRLLGSCPGRLRRGRRRLARGQRRVRRGRRRVRRGRLRQDLGWDLGRLGRPTKRRSWGLARMDRRLRSRVGSVNRLGWRLGNPMGTGGAPVRARTSEFLMR